MRAHILFWFRQVHLYLGLFTAPAILFFAFSGALQTLGLNDRSPDGSYMPPHWISVLAQIHKKQTAQLPQRRPSAPEGAAKPQKASAAIQASPSPAQAAVPQPRPQANPPQTPPKPVALKAFFLLVCLSLVLSTVTGAYMSWRLRRNRAVLVAVFLAGILLPLLLMKL